MLLGPGDAFHRILVSPLARACYRELACCGRDLGSRKQNRAPCPRRLSHQIVPPSASANSLATASPYPVDDASAVGVVLRRTPRWKGFAWSSSLIPGPHRSRIFAPEGLHCSPSPPRAPYDQRPMVHAPLVRYSQIATREAA